MRPTRRTRLIRGLAAASVATFVALASHVWAGDPVPGALGIMVPWVLSAMVCTLLAGRRAGAGGTLALLRRTIAVAVSQLLFHLLFVLGSITPRGGLAPHTHATALTFEGAPLPDGAGMWGAHALAAVVTVVVLQRGEALVQALLVAASDLGAWLRRVVRAVAPVPVAALTVRRWVSAPALHRRDPLRAAVRRRGPPVVLV